MIAIIDYGLGNVMAFAHLYHKLNIPIIIAREASDLLKATKIILPGVGAFDYAMELLNDSGMRQILDELVMDRHIPILGICVGMQILAKSSEEGTQRGLGWIKGEVRKFDPSSMIQKTHLPHMGWNDVYPVGSNILFHNLEKDARFYFLHSYYFHCHNHENIIAFCEYGIRFDCAVNHKNIYGVQFHPEKSHQCGTKLLINFAKI